MRSFLLVLAFLVIAFFLAPFVSFAECSGVVSMNVPAVIGDDGGLVNATIRSVPGDGNVFIGVEPRTGTDTQTSVENAITVAKDSVEFEDQEDALDCDLLVTFDRVDTGGYIEGPSAGMAISVLAYSLFEDTTPRDDTILTGTVSPNGRVGSVGGLYEKAKAAANAGADYFIVPPTSIYEMLLLQEVKDDYGLVILETDNAIDVFGFMLFNQSIEQTEFTVSEIEPPDVPQYSGDQVEEFRSVSEDMIDLMNDTTNGLRTDDKKSRQIKKFFENQANIHSILLERGYVFTAANSAFLDYIEVSTIDAILDKNVDIEKKNNEIEECLDSIPEKQMTNQNFEWIVGSDLRQVWAETMLFEISLSEPLIAEEEYITYHDLMYADAWCEVSKSIIKSANSEGKPIDEKIWKGFAKEMLEIADESVHSPDTQNRMEIARESYERGNYGAAIFDSVFVIEMDASDAELVVFTEEEFDRELENLTSSNRTSLWGRVYQTQGIFLTQGENANKQSAYRILRLSEGLDYATEIMVEEIELQEKDENTTDIEEFLVTFLQVSIFLIFILILFYIILARKKKRGTHGRNKNNGYRGFTRDEQKKGRTRIPTNNVASRS